jgi:hypothetical protein
LWRRARKLLVEAGDQGKEEKTASEDAFQPPHSNSSILRLEKPLNLRHDDHLFTRAWGGKVKSRLRAQVREIAMSTSAGEGGKIIPLLFLPRSGIVPKEDNYKRLEKTRDSELTQRKRYELRFVDNAELARAEL